MVAFQVPSSSIMSSSKFSFYSNNNKPKGGKSSPSAPSFTAPTPEEAQLLVDLASAADRLLIPDRLPPVVLVSQNLWHLAVLKRAAQDVLKTPSMLDAFKADKDAKELTKKLTPMKDSNLKDFPPGPLAMALAKHIKKLTGITKVAALVSNYASYCDARPDPCPIHYIDGIQESWMETIEPIFDEQDAQGEDYLTHLSSRFNYTFSASAGSFSYTQQLDPDNRLMEALASVIYGIQANDIECDDVPKEWASSISEINTWLINGGDGKTDPGYDPVFLPDKFKKKSKGDDVKNITRLFCMVVLKMIHHLTSNQRFIFGKLSIKESRKQAKRPAPASDPDVLLVSEQNQPKKPKTEDEDLPPIPPISAVVLNRQEQPKIHVSQATFHELPMVKPQDDLTSIKSQEPYALLLLNVLHRHSIKKDYKLPALNSHHLIQQILTKLFKGNKTPLKTAIDEKKIFWGQFELLQMPVFDCFSNTPVETFAKALSKSKDPFACWLAINTEDHGTTVYSVNTTEDKAVAIRFPDPKGTFINAVSLKQGLMTAPAFFFDDWVDTKPKGTPSPSYDPPSHLAPQACQDEDDLLAGLFD